MRSLSVEATVFFLIVSAVSSIPLVYFPGSEFLLVGIVFTIIYFALAYFCWKLKQWAFIAATILALLVVVLTIVISGLRYQGDELLVVVQLLIIFFSYRGYREVQEVGGQSAKE